MLKRILAFLMVLTMFVFAGCNSSTKSNELVNPPGHEELEAVIGMRKAEALEKLGLSENELIADTTLPNVYNTTKTTTFAGVEFAVSLGIFPEDIICAVYYTALYDGDISSFAKDVHTVANILEKNLTDDNLIKNIPLSDLEAAYAKGRMEEDVIDITENAPENVQNHIEYMMSTDYWKDNFYLTENIPLTPGYLCELVASCIAPETENAVIRIRYHINVRPGNYTTVVKSE